MTENPEQLQATNGNGKIKLPPSSLEEILSAVPRGRSTAVSYAYLIAQRAEVGSPWKQLAEAMMNDTRADIGHLCDRVGIQQADFLAEITRELFPVADEAKKFAHALSSIVVAQRLPKVVERGMIEAAKPDGIADRHFVLQKEGYHIAPKGTVINMQQLNQTSAGSHVFEDEVASMDKIFDADDTDAIEGHLLPAGEGDFTDTSDTSNLTAEEKELQPA